MEWTIWPALLLFTISLFLPAVIEPSEITYGYKAFFNSFLFIIFAPPYSILFFTNPLYILTIFLLKLKPTYSIFVSPFLLMLMYSWTTLLPNQGTSEGHLGAGFYIWFLSGIWVFVLSTKAATNPAKKLGWMFSITGLFIFLVGTLWVIWMKARRTWFPGLFRTISWHAALLLIIGMILLVLFYSTTKSKRPHPAGPA